MSGSGDYDSAPTDRVVIPDGTLDATRCPGCGVRLVHSKAKAGVRQGDNLYVSGLEQVCPECGHDWRLKL